MRLLLVTLTTAVAALKLPAQQPRRRPLVGAVAAAAAASALVIGPRAAFADEVSALLYGSSTASGASVFVGTYTDPMHPGGTRTISLLDTRLGPYQLAKVVGGGGEGEPSRFELPAMVSPTPGQKDAWLITIDFSPKGGPKDFTGQWDADGIRFPPTPRQIERGELAGNRWPKVRS